MTKVRRIPHVRARIRKIPGGTVPGISTVSDSTTRGATLSTGAPTIPGFTIHGTDRTTGIPGITTPGMFPIGTIPPMDTAPTTIGRGDIIGIIRSTSSMISAHMHAENRVTVERAERAKDIGRRDPQRVTHRRRGRRQDRGVQIATR